MIRRALLAVVLTLSATHTPVLAQSGNITISPTTAPAELFFQGPAYNSTTGTPLLAPGFSIGYLDDTQLTVPADPADAISAGIFRLHRPQGFYEWLFSVPVTDEIRPAMRLGNDHSLTLYDPAGGDHIVRTLGASGDLPSAASRWSPTRIPNWTA